MAITTHLVGWRWDSNPAAAPESRSEHTGENQHPCAGTRSWACAPATQVEGEKQLASGDNLIPGATAPPTYYR